MAWGAPLWLWLLPLVAALAVGDLWRGKRAAAVVGRAVLGALLVAAAAQPVLLRRAPVPEVVVYALDRSRSIPRAELARARAEIEAERELCAGCAGLVLFADDALIHGAPGGAWAWPEPLAPLGRRTDLSAGLKAAASLVPEGARGRLVVYTDGRDLEGQDLAAGGHSVEVRALDPGRPEAALSSLEVERAEVAPGARAEGILVVHGGAAGVSGDAELRLDGAVILELSLAVAAGATEEIPWSLSVPAEQPSGPVALEAHLAGLQPALAGLLVVPAPRVWVVAPEPRDARALTRMLRADGLLVEARAPDALGSIDADVVVLAGVPAARGLGAPHLDERGVAALERFVRSGGGLVVLGGERAFDQGDYHHSPLADLLPVDLDPDALERLDAVSLVLALDKSGSMAARAGGGGNVVLDRLRGGNAAGSKMALVNQAALAALDRLRGADQVGVLAVDTEARWVLGLQGAPDARRRAREVAGIVGGGGGIHVVNALHQAHDALAGAGTPLRHAVLFADAGDVGGRSGSRGAARQIAARMGRDEITLSVIGIGTPEERDVAFLRDLAREAGGRFALTDDLRNLQALFVEETEQVVGRGLREGSLRAVPRSWHPALRGVALHAAPPLLGVNRVLERPHTRVLASTEAGPLLASWRVGDGEVVAWTSDAGTRWAPEWLAWPGYARMWTQLVRHLAAGARAARSDVQLAAADGALEVTWRGADGTAVAAVAPALSVDGDAVPLAATVPGAWRAEVALGTLLRAELEDGSESLASWVGAVPDEELRERTPDADVLAALAALPVAEVVPGRRVVPLAAWLLLAALLWLPVDAWARRPR